MRHSFTKRYFREMIFLKFDRLLDCIVTSLCRLVHIVVRIMLDHSHHLPNRGSPLLLVLLLCLTANISLMRCLVVPMHAIVVISCVEEVSPLHDILSFEYTIWPQFCASDLPAR